MSTAGIPGKINVRQFNIINNFGGSKASQSNIWNVVKGMTIYEGIFDTCMYGMAKIEDSNNLYSTLPITNDSYLKIVIENPTTGQKVQGLYRIYKVSDIHQESTKLQTYIIHFVSVELYNFKKVRISKHVKGDIPGAIQEIHSQVSTKPISVTKDAAKANIIIPYLNAGSAIQLLVENAKWKGTRSDYCYWETFRGYNCKSLAACMLENPIHDFSTSISTGNEIYNGFDYSDFIKITDMIGDQNYDGIHTLYGGAAGSTIYVYNPLEGSCDIKMIGEQPLSQIYSFSSDTLDYRALSARHQILSNIASGYYYIRVPGMLSRSAGDLANVTIYNGNNMNIKDITLSGRRLICGIAHVISMDEYYQNITLGDYYLGDGK